jgi:hypothetical protein
MPATAKVPKDESGSSSTKCCMLVPLLDPQRTLANTGRRIDQLLLLVGEWQGERLGETGSNQQT